MITVLIVSMNKPNFGLYNFDLDFGILVKQNIIEFTSQTKVTIMIICEYEI